jgi:flagellar hook-basal body complex protein FliE
MANPGIDQMVNQLRAVASETTRASATSDSEGGQDFVTLLKSAVDEVHSAQQEAKQLTEQFELGEQGANLQDVVMSLQKASLSFQTMVQVRNKLVSAYQEIMNMSV